MKRKIAILSIFLFIFTLLASCLANDDRLVILYTAETHARLKPCDCPIREYGGIARRKSLIDNLRQECKNLILLDAGAAVAGGEFDEDRINDTLDFKRSEIYLKAMALMGYDALALGDEELSLGIDKLGILSDIGIPLLAANARVKTREDFIHPYITKRIAGQNICIIGISPPTADIKAKGHQKDIDIVDPVESLVSIVKQKPNHLIIVLSHLDEQASKGLIEQCPEVDLLINANGKMNPAPFEHFNHTLIARDTYQGRNIGMVSVRLVDNKPVIEDYRLIPVDALLPDDAMMLSLVKQYEDLLSSEAGKALKVEIFVRAFHQPSLQALKETIKATSMFDDSVVTLEPRPFGGMNADDSLEYADQNEILRIGIIAQRYPDKLESYIDCLLTQVRGEPWQDCAVKADLEPGMLLVDLNRAKGDELTAHSPRRAGLQAAPALIIGNQRYNGRLSKFDILAAICNRLGDAAARYAPCRQIPQCFSDQDCIKPGFKGKCNLPGTPQAACQYTEAVKIKLDIISDPRARFSNLQRILSTTMFLFPGATVRTIDCKTSQGKALIESLGVELAPVLIFGAEVKDAESFQRMKQGFRYHNGKYILEPKATSANIYLRRPRIPGKLDIFFDPISPGALDFLNSYLPAILSAFDRVDFHPLVTASDLQGKGNKIRLEQAKILAAIDNNHKERELEYLRKLAKHGATLFWDEIATSAGIDTNTIYKKIKSKEAIDHVRREHAFIEDLGINQELVILYENRERIGINDPLQLVAFIDYIFQRRPSEK